MSLRARLSSEGYEIILFFQVESTGQFDSDDLFLESVRGLRSKCKRLRRNLDNMMR